MSEVFEFIGLTVVGVLAVGVLIGSLAFLKYLKLVKSENVFQKDEKYGVATHTMKVQHTMGNLGRIDNAEPIAWDAVHEILKELEFGKIADVEGIVRYNPYEGDYSWDISTHGDYLHSKLNGKTVQTIKISEIGKLAEINSFDDSEVLTELVNEDLRDE